LKNSALPSGRADQAMYGAKKAGHAVVVAADDAEPLV
jgi:hypothetical protein